MKYVLLSGHCRPIWYIMPCGGTTEDCIQMQSTEYNKICNVDVATTVCRIKTLKRKLKTHSVSGRYHPAQLWSLSASHDVRRVLRLTYLLTCLFTYLFTYYCYSNI